MAAEDFVVADRDVSAITAGAKVTQTVQATPDGDAKTRATAAGVSNAAYINYAAALTTFEGRDDIESLADRRKREISTTFAPADFMRAIADGVAPTPGTPTGKADQS